MKDLFGREQPKSAKDKLQELSACVRHGWAESKKMSPATREFIADLELHWQRLSWLSPDQQKRIEEIYKEVF